MESTRTDVVVVGGGIAGLAAATALVERGLRVSVLESESFLGGRAASWGDALSSGEASSMERGFHAFFRQYYNLRRLLQRVDPALSQLEPLDDYPIYGPRGARESFSGLPRRAPLNVIELTRRTKTISMRDLMRVDVRAALNMLTFDGPATYAEYDPVSARAYLDSLNFPPDARRMLFDVFTHSFFNPEASMSAGELLMMFHFYFMGNPEGLIFDVVKRPMSEAFWAPLGRYIEERGGALQLGCRALRVARNADGWTVESDAGTIEADAVVLAVTVPALQAIVERSPDLADCAWRARVRSLGLTLPFAVWRLWLDRPTAPERTPFVGTSGLGIIDNISLYHLFQDDSRAWAQRHGGAVVELHAYAVPEDYDEERVKRELLASLHGLYPETAEAEIVDERFLMRRDCPSFDAGSYAARPTTETPFPGLYLAGDFTRQEFPSALMERAAASGFVAANGILRGRALDPEPILTIPERGLLAPVARRRGEGLLARGAARLRARAPWTFGRSPQSPDRASSLRAVPDWQQADPGWIGKALRRASSQPSGGWYVIDAVRSIGAKPVAYAVAGRRLVVWRGAAGLRVAPDACPHLGASLADGHVDDNGCVVCPWHGLALGEDKHGGWQPHLSFDDGVLLWVRLPEPEQTPSERPFLPARPMHYIDATIRMEAACEPQDVVANRLDPWHGTYFHPHSFARLKVLERSEDAITVRVVVRLMGRVGMEVDARFDCPDPRSIVMTIIDGEGVGSVVETHATPIAPGRSAIVETTLATSERLGFRMLSAVAPTLRPVMHWAARRLWVEDAAYAERRFALRNGGA